MLLLQVHSEETPRKLSHAKTTIVSFTRRDSTIGGIDLKTFFTATILTVERCLGVDMTYSIFLCILCLLEMS